MFYNFSIALLRTKNEGNFNLLGNVFEIKLFMMKIIYSFFLLFLHLTSFSQEDLLQALGKDSATKEYITSAFKSSRVINGHSMEFIGKGVLDFRILHRFGPVNQGIEEFFGLDQASMRMGFDYGLSKNLTIESFRAYATNDIP